MLSAQPSLTPLQVRLLIEATARPFPTTGGDNGTGAVVPTCTPPKYDALGNPVDQLECYCTIDTCGAGMLDAGAAVRAASAGMPAAGVEVEGLWWNAPGESESGWGINLAHQGSVIFATWFTYDASGKAWWLSMRADRVGANPDTYAGQLYRDPRPAVQRRAVRSEPRDAHASVGSGTLTFADVNRGTFSYTVNGTPADQDDHPPGVRSAADVRVFGAARLRAGDEFPGSVVERARETRNPGGGSTSRIRATTSSRPGSPTTSTARRCGCRCLRPGRRRACTAGN